MKKLDILLVDSSLEMALVLTDFLLTKGCRVDHFVNAKEAILGEKRYAHDFLIVSDRVEGTTIRLLIESLVRLNPDLFVIYLSPGDRRLSYEVSGGHPYFRRLSTPVVLEELWEIMSLNRLGNVV